jgi:hypothetical protein
VLRFFVLFIVLQAALFGLELTPLAQAYFVEPWTIALAHISTNLVTLFDHDVVATGRIIRSTANGFAVLKAPDIPSILVETAFISNPEEEAKLRDPRQQRRFAESMADGVRRYFAQNPALARA